MNLGMLVFSVSVNCYVCLHWIFIRALINGTLFQCSIFLIKESVNYIMKQVLGETSEKITEETFLTQSDAIIIVINCSPENIQH